ncbi:MAG: DEAD/DEAH box helicase family protein [Lactobacillaceae bacterium]|jgi:superfamily II DNA or RNA helicase|nr:DEAD/DEAH box helicase family protein [Lactobacillaceae bacterium]
MKNTTIITTKTVYPKIYAYNLPNRKEDIGWIKIGYTERKNVDERILEQTKTAAFEEKYNKLWSYPAKFANSNKWFKDKELHAYLRNFKDVKQRVKSHKKTEWFYYNGTPEKAEIDFQDFSHNDLNQAVDQLEYTLRGEQEAAVQVTLAYAKEHQNGEFLWNAKPRFGKTLTTYELARQLDAINVLVVTNRPAIANSWFDDFEKFIAWQTNYKFVSTSDSLKDRRAMSREQFLDQLIDQNDDLRQIAFISLQDLKGAISFGGSYDKLKWVEEINWDLLVVDEAHEGIDTFKTEFSFEQIKRKFTLNLSGTPFKAIASGKFSNDQIYNWTYADEQAAKINWNDIDENNPYDKLPKLNLFSYQMSPMIADEINKGAQIDGQNREYAFDLNEFFKTKDNGKFIHEEDIIKWLDTLTHNEKYPFSTEELRSELKHTFWILDRVDSAKALLNLMRKHEVFQNYKIVLAAGDGRENEDDQLENLKAFDRVRKAIAENDKTITLSVGQLTTGVTIPEWTAVLMLSNMKSPSLYMQAAFRSQNPWTFEANGQMHQKQNAYVFDFAPERTLITYDEFANNLSSETTNGGGTSDYRKDNILKLLNFFPVIAEDHLGKMVELNVDQVLTIPKAIKAQEIVKRGFMSNLLFQNIAGIFSSNEAREILENLNPVDTGKITPRITDEKINTSEVSVNKNGEIEIQKDIVISQTQVHFGSKIYADILDDVKDVIENPTNKITDDIVLSYTNNIQADVKELAIEQGLSAKQADNIAKENKNEFAIEIKKVQKTNEIKLNQAKVEYEKQIQQAENNPEAIKIARVAFESEIQKNEQDFKEQIIQTVKEKTPQLAQEATQKVLLTVEEKKKNSVEDDVRARLRGFARTIPSFLMAYGNPNTTLDNFDQTINDSVFKEVTGITLDQFRVLRDNYNFFDEVVFNESIQEFLNKRNELANYFDDSHDEDIFDYIPPQKTNQIFTPKKVVMMMIDQLEKEDPKIFSDPNKTFADLYVKSGLYLTEIVRRLYKGLEEQIPDKKKRLKHILEHQIYGFAPTEIIYRIARNFIFGFSDSIEEIDKSHFVLLDTTPFAKGEGDFESKLEELFGGDK